MNEPPSRGNSHPRGHAYGVTHDNTRHTTRFTVIGNHLAQHAKLSLVAIALAVHIQSLPANAPVDIKTLAERFPEGRARIAAGLRELEAHGYLRRVRERTSTGRIVTRTISCNQPRPATARRPHAPTPAAPRPAGPREPRKKRHPLPPVPQPAYPHPTLLQQAADLLAGLHREDPRLLLSACDTAHLAPGVATWLQYEVPPSAVRRALTTDLPPEGVRRPAALLAHRLTAQLPPPPPVRAPAAPPPERLHLVNCDGCDRAFRAPGKETRCRDCREAAADPAGAAAGLAPSRPYSS